MLSGGPGPMDPQTLPGGGGVVALLDEAGRLVQLLGGQNLRQLLGTRLAPVTDTSSRRPDLAAVVRQLRWRPTGSVFETTLHYLTCARVLYPGDYLDRIALGPAWFARAFVDADVPRWSVDKYALDGEAVDIGPFADRSSARAFVERLESVFDLCRYVDTLRQAPHGQLCAYYDMGRCDGPCAGRVTMAAYRTRLQKSADFAAGRASEWLAECEAQMQSAARAQAFERAAALREQLASARKLAAFPGRIAATPTAFRYLIVQRGLARKLCQPFVMRAGNLEVLSPVRVEDVPAAVAAWRAQLYATPPSPASLAEAQCASEHVWLVAHFVARRARPTGLFLTQAELDSDDAGARIVRYYQAR